MNGLLDCHPAHYDISKGFNDYSNDVYVPEGIIFYINFWYEGSINYFKFKITGLSSTNQIILGKNYVSDVEIQRLFGL